MIIDFQFFKESPYSLWTLLLCSWDGKEFACSAGLTQVQSLRWRVSKKVPWRRKWQPTLILLPGEFHGRGAWRPQSDTTKRLTHTYTHNFNGYIHFIIWMCLNLFNNIIDFFNHKWCFYECALPASLTTFVGRFLEVLSLGILTSNVFEAYYKK